MAYTTVSMVGRAGARLKCDDSAFVLV